MTIDIYTHFLPTRYAREIQRNTAHAHPDVPNIDLLMQFFPNLCHLDPRLKHMDKNGVAVQVFTPLPIPVESFVGQDQEKAQALTMLANDAMAETVSSTGGWGVGVALLCFLDASVAAGELERAVSSLGMKGGMVFTNLQGRPLDLPELFPIYEKAVALDVPLWIHPVSWNYYDWVRDYLIWQIFGWPIDTTFAMARLVYGGVLERFPSLKLITHHAGGTTPFLIGRVIDTYTQNEELHRLSSGGEDGGKTLCKTPVEYFQMFFGDTAVSGIPGAMRCAYEMFGPTRLLFGSDYPFGPQEGERFIATNLDAVRSLGLERGDLDRIMFKNACGLLNVQTGPHSAGEGPPSQVGAC